MSRKWVSDLFDGIWPERINRPTRRKLEAYLGDAVPNAPARATARYAVEQTPLGECVLIAVGRFEFIEEMAAKISDMARRSGHELRTAAASLEADHATAQAVGADDALPTPVSAPASAPAARRRRRGA